MGPLLLVWVCLGAAGPGEPENSKLPVYHFTVFAAEILTGLGYIPEPESEVVPLRFRPTERSTRYEFLGETPFQLVDLNSGAVVAEAKIPPPLGDLLFLILPKDGGRYSIQVIDDSPVAGDGDQLRILNLSGLALTGSINGRAIPIGDGMNAPVKLSGTMLLELRTEFRGRSFRTLTETLEAGPSRPNLLILFPPHRPGSLEVQWRLI